MEISQLGSVALGERDFRFVMFWGGLPEAFAPSLAQLLVLTASCPLWAQVCAETHKYIFFFFQLLGKVQKLRSSLR